MDAPDGTVAAEEITPAELRLAARNHGLPLEALRYDITPAGLHYLLIHYDIPAVDAAVFRARGGRRGREAAEPALDDLQAARAGQHAGHLRVRRQRPRPAAAAPAQPALADRGGRHRRMGRHAARAAARRGRRARRRASRRCSPGSTTAWRAARRRPTSARCRSPTSSQALLVYEMNGAPLPPQHGFPLRLVVPGWYGMTNVKWLARITLLEEPFEGYQNAVAYRMYGADGEPGDPVTRMLPRSLMVPPGVPDFMTRERHLAPGPVTLRGRAWSGYGPVERVEVSTDGGETFADAGSTRPLGAAAWRGWRFAWDAPPGEHVLCSRATDAAGNAQPLDRSLEPQGLREQRGGAHPGRGRCLDCPGRAHLLRHPAHRPQAPRQLHRGDPRLPGGTGARRPGDLLHRRPARHGRRLRPRGAARPTCSTPRRC